MSMQNRIELARHFAERGFTHGVEVGVFEGYFSKVLLDANPRLALICVDSWGPESRRVAAYDVALQTLAPYMDRTTIFKTTSLIAASKLPDKWFDFVFIDANHSYESVKRDIEAWTPKVRSGGIVSGHDYYKGKAPASWRAARGGIGVIEAVDEYVAAHGYTLHTTPYDGLNPIKDDRQPCWWFDKK